MTLIEKLTSENRLFTVLYDNLPAAMRESSLYQRTASYLQSYLDHQKLTAHDLSTIYNEFIIRFNKDCKRFIKTGKYPNELGSADYKLGRTEYDFVLLISVLFAPHRFQIMNLLQTCGCSGTALYIGIGSGLELSLNQNAHDEAHAYDLSINSFVQRVHPSVRFHQEPYEGQQEEYYNTIYAIELLEHLEDPYSLIEICYQSLTKGGRLVLTTASDLPQFDHLYNFPKDHIKFEHRIKHLGFKIEKKETIEHEYLVLPIRPINTFYILTKK